MDKDTKWIIFTIGCMCNYDIHKNRLKINEIFDENILFTQGQNLSIKLLTLIP